MRIADWQILVATLLALEQQAMAWTVHRLQAHLLILTNLTTFLAFSSTTCNTKHIGRIVVPMTRRLPQRFFVYCGSYDFAEAIYSVLGAQKVLQLIEQRCAIGEVQWRARRVGRCYEKMLLGRKVAMVSGWSGRFGGSGVYGRRGSLRRPRGATGAATPETMVLNGPGLAADGTGVVDEGRGGASRGLHWPWFLLRVPPRDDAGDRRPCTNQPPRPTADACRHVCLPAIHGFTAVLQLVVLCRCLFRLCFAFISLSYPLIPSLSSPALACCASGSHCCAFCPLTAQSLSLFEPSLRGPIVCETASSQPCEHKLEPPLHW